MVSLPGFVILISANLVCANEGPLPQSYHSQRQLHGLQCSPENAHSTIKSSKNCCRPNGIPAWYYRCQPFLVFQCCYGRNKSQIALPPVFRSITPRDFCWRGWWNALLMKIIILVIPWVQNEQRTGTTLFCLVSHISYSNFIVSFLGYRNNQWKMSYNWLYSPYDCLTVNARGGISSTCMRSSSDPESESHVAVRRIYSTVRQVYYSEWTQFCLNLPV